MEGLSAGTGEGAATRAGVAGVSADAAGGGGNSLRLHDVLSPSQSSHGSRIAIVVRRRAGAPRQSSVRRGLISCMVTYPNHRATDWLCSQRNWPSGGVTATAFRTMASLA